MAEFRTPKEREFIEVEGSVWTIDDRGSNMIALARQMERTVSFLDDIATPGSRTESGEGKAMDSIREEGAEVRDELELAAERYLPTGEAMVQYAEDLLATQGEIKDVIDDAVKSFASYEEALEELSTARAVESTFTMPSDPTQTDRDNKDLIEGALAGAQTRADSAQQRFEEDGSAYDKIFDRWETEEYDEAVDKITEAINADLNDSGWDNFFGGLDTVLEVLKWVGLVLAVLVLIFGGPILALAVLIVGVVVLIGTIVLAMDGRKGLKDIAWAAVGVLPIAKLGKGLSAFGKEILGQFKTPIAQIQSIAGLKTLPVPGYGGPVTATMQRNFEAFKGKFGPYMFSSGRPTWDGAVQRFTGGSGYYNNAVVTNQVNSSNPFFNHHVNVFFADAFIPKAVGNAERNIATTKSAFDWADRAVSLVNGEASGTLKKWLSGG